MMTVQRKNKIIIGTFLITVLMITTKGLLTDKYCPKGVSLQKVENHCIAVGIVPHILISGFITIFLFM